jgi:iron complex transport system ATP-binding protein
MIVLEDLYFGYRPDSPVIRGLSMNIEAGQIHCILGPNGSGKTTLLQLILGYLQPDRGRVVIDGKNIHSLSPAERSRLMGYVPQINEYPYNYRVREAVLLGRAAGKPGWFTPGIGDERAVDATLERLDLLSLSERPVHSLSGGELQLVNIARSLITNRRILILDEPESHLDPARDLRLHRMLIELASGGIAIALTSHNPLLVSHYAHAVSGLIDGSIGASGPPGQVLRPEALRRIYGIEYRLISDGTWSYPVPDYPRGD